MIKPNDIRDALAAHAAEYRDAADAFRASGGSFAAWTLADREKMARCLTAVEDAVEVRAARWTAARAALLGIRRRLEDDVHAAASSTRVRAKAAA